MPLLSVTVGAGVPAWALTARTRSVNRWPGQLVETVILEIRDCRRNLSDVTVFTTDVGCCAGSAVVICKS